MKSLDAAIKNYWSAKTPNEEWLAYNSILLYGGADGYPPTDKAWRLAAARLLRRFALWAEGREL